MTHDTDFAWALIGPGNIAHRFADAVHRLPGTWLRSVHGRDAARASAFAQHWCRDGQPAPSVAPSLQALLADERIDGVYIATPHASHADCIRACLEAGKPVLCEKPLVTHLAAAQALTALAHERGVFLMEALWTRFLPAYAAVRQWLASGAIGAVQSIQSSFCFAAPIDPRSRIFAPELAGGALLDIGIYNVAITRWVLESQRGSCPAPDRIGAQAVLAPTGVDQRVAATLNFEGGVVSQFVCAVDGHADNALRIHGERGHIELPHHFWEATEARLCRPGQAPEVVHAPFRINGFEGQIEEAMRCVRSGLIESPQMPHAESLAIVACLDELRRAVGVRYPFE